MQMGYSASTADTIDSDLRSKRQYMQKWRKFDKFCAIRNVEAKTAPMPIICNFLQHILDGNKAYNTIKTYRSALSKFHDPIDGMAVGKHPMVLRFLRGVFQK